MKCCFKSISALLFVWFWFFFFFLIFKYPKQHFKIFTVQNGQQCSMGWYCRRSVWLSLWRNCLWPFLKTSSNSKCSSHSPLWAPPIPVHLLPPLYLCLVSREKNKAPYVLVLENTWINVLFFVQKKKNLLSSLFFLHNLPACQSGPRFYDVIVFLLFYTHRLKANPCGFLTPKLGKNCVIYFYFLTPISLLVVQPPVTADTPQVHGDWLLRRPSLHSALLIGGWHRLRVWLARAASKCQQRDGASPENGLFAYKIKAPCSRGTGGLNLLTDYFISRLYLYSKVGWISDSGQTTAWGPCVGC